MLRRDFVRNLFYSAGLILLRPLKLLRAQQTGNSLLKIKKDGRITARIQARFFRNNPYIKLDDFAEANNFGIFTNTTRKKTVLRISAVKFKFTHNNPFVVVNDQIFQILFTPVWQNEALWVSVDELISLINEFTQFRLEYDAPSNTISFTHKNVNITTIDFEHKSNGTLILVSTTQPFADKQLNTKIVNGWLYLEIVGGKGDAKALSRKVKDDVIAEIRALQFEQLLSIGFRLKKTPESSEVIFNSGSNQILLTLRNSSIAHNDSDDQTPSDKLDEELERQKSEWLIDTIVIDPGHGGKDPGALGYYKLKEKDIVLAVGLKLGEYLKKRLPGVKILYTRKTDTFIPLWKRTKFANENHGKLFVSLHCNSNRKRSVNGFETYFLSAEKDERARDVVLKENESIMFETSDDKKRYEGVNFVLATLAQNAFIKYSQYLASVVQKSLKKFLRPVGMRDRGVKQGPFWVMVGATMPNILIEMGYISNKSEAKLLRRKSTQAKIALGITEGIIKFKNDFESAL
ncbi:MAG: N-acetylmuramoyl-L-alanine amidase [Calditrichaeota bacterium]|nr:N-acetylmuramoyl-L-alanine amidase [Calditrichota bacterium]